MYVVQVIIQHYSYDDALLGSQRCEFGFLLPRANATSCRCRRELGEAANIFKDEQERRVCWRESHMESEFFFGFFLELVVDMKLGWVVVAAVVVVVVGR